MRLSPAREVLEQESMEEGVGLGDGDAAVKRGLVGLGAWHAAGVLLAVALGRCATSAPFAPVTGEQLARLTEAQHVVDRGWEAHQRKPPR